MPIFAWFILYYDSIDDRNYQVAIDRETALKAQEERCQISEYPFPGVRIVLRESLHGK